MERLESLYANKFTIIPKRQQSGSSDLCPGIPFGGLVKNIIAERTDNPGEEFRYSPTPNEFVKKVATPIEHIYYLIFITDLFLMTSKGPVHQVLLHVSR